MSEPIEPAESPKSEVGRKDPLRRRLFNTKTKRLIGAFIGASVTLLPLIGKPTASALSVLSSITSVCGEHSFFKENYLYKHLCVSAVGQQQLQTASIGQQYQGRWVGKWDGQWKVVLTISVESDKGIMVQYDHIENEGQPIVKSGFYCDAVSDRELDCGDMRIAFSNAKFAQATIITDDKTTTRTASLRRFMYVPI